MNEINRPYNHNQNPHSEAGISSANSRLQLSRRIGPNAVRGFSEAEEREPIDPVGMADDLLKVARRTADEATGKEE